LPESGRRWHRVAYYSTALRRCGNPGDLARAEVEREAARCGAFSEYRRAGGNFQLEATVYDRRKGTLPASARPRYSRSGKVSGRHFFVQITKNTERLAKKSTITMREVRHCLYFCNFYISIELSFNQQATST
jgi:hypothetical protein